MKKLFDQLHITSPRNKTPKAEIPPREITPRENIPREISESTVILPPQEPEDPHHLRYGWIQEKSKLQETHFAWASFFTI
jgi:hypothetical protein